MSAKARMARPLICLACALVLAGCCGGSSDYGVRCGVSVPVFAAPDE